MSLREFGVKAHYLFLGGKVFKKEKMPIPVHVICGKCGSLNIRIERDKDAPDLLFFRCNDCSEITSVDTINEWKEEQFPRPRKKKN